MMNKNAIIQFFLSLLFIFSDAPVNGIFCLDDPLHQFLATEETAGKSPLFDISPMQFSFRKRTAENINVHKQLQNVVTDAKQIKILEFPYAHNPSIISDGEDGYLMTFRVMPDKKRLWISYIGIVRLNKAFEVVSEPQLIDPRLGLAREAPSQAEDARIFAYKGDFYLIYNDNETITNPNSKQRRDLYVAKIVKNGSTYGVDVPLKLKHETRYETASLWQKNWTPFEWNGQLMISYTYEPHEVLIVDMETGICKPCYEVPTNSKWKFGELRGGSPALLLNGQYVTFFHSSKIAKSKESRHLKMLHYYMGVLVFKAEPPFEIIKMTPAPIIGKNFYTVSNFNKRVVYPGGFVVEGENIYVVYGKDDAEVWVATLNKKALEKVLLPPTYDLK